MSLGVKGDLKQEIFNEVNENVRALERLFPSAVKDGQVDFEALKEELGNFEEVGPEKYELTWSGKQNAKKIAQQDIVGKTLKYIPKDSKNPKTTENLYIEGDNLEVLKLLRQNYYGAIKMIYIDPPYNTGNDFVYNDNYKMNKYKSDQEEGNISDLGERYTVNSKSSNKYHANWLNMIYSRLKVAKDLLSEDGVIFASIDDNELNNLKKIFDEIFDESNFIAQLNIITGANQAGEGVKIQKNVEYCLVYCKNCEKLILNRVDKTEEVLRNLNDAPTPLETRQDMGYSIYYNDKTGDILPIKDYIKEKIYINNEKDVYKDNIELIENGYTPIRPGMRNKKLHRWRWGMDTFRERINEVVIVKKDKKYGVYFKQQGFNPAKNILKFSGGTNEVKDLFEGRKLFDYPKSISFIKYIISICTTENSIILDFFSGSATTAHAVMKINSEDLGRRKFIMVQLPEETDEKSEAYKAGYENICQIGRKRIDKAGDKITEENKDKEGIEDLDIGFKVFRVGDTNIRWNYEKEDLKTLSNEVTIRSSEEQTTFDFIAATNNQVNLDETVSAKDRLDFMPGFKDIDIVYEILLRQRDIPLSAKVELLEDIGKRTYIFADSYLVCLEEDITVELIEKLAELNPLPIKFILRDSAFGDDIALKDEAYRRLKALIERNSGESKKTYTVEFI